jgi:nanoRNase/pAp phosphatase (c-di-AMP/oligoRNAs hydrolase)
LSDLTAAAADGIAAAAAQPGFGNTAVGSDFELMLAEIRAHDRFLLTAHEGPDGDALGSLLGMHHLLTKLGKDSVMFLAAKEFPLPIEYRFLPLEEVFHEPPADRSLFSPTAPTAG